MPAPSTPGSAQQDADPEESARCGTVFWITGLAGAGKSSVGRGLAARLRAAGHDVVLLDGDRLRAELFPETGYSRAERLELARQYSRLCRLLSAQGQTVVIATISLFPEIWAQNRSSLAHYCEILLRASPEVLRQRRPKLYGGESGTRPDPVCGQELEVWAPPEPHLVLKNDGERPLEALVEDIWTRFVDRCNAAPAARLADPAGAAASSQGFTASGPELAAEPRVRFGTKAETLERLAPHLASARVLPQLRFTKRDWILAPAQRLDQLAELGWLDRPLIVRSSALLEDQADRSQAGRWLSQTSQSGTPALRAAIDAVAKALPDPQGLDQIFIQPELTEVLTSGVIFTRDPSNGAHYFIVSQEKRSGRTGAITSGSAEERETHYVHFRCSQAERGELGPLIRLAEELMQLVGRDSLDIEFAQTLAGGLYLLQVRPLRITAGPLPTAEEESRALNGIRKRLVELSRPQPYLLGSRTLFGRMPDWNPAEILGLRPRPLALSLYRELITDSIWAYQRHNYGYRNLRSFPLMASFCGLPFIDVRVSFESFVPADLPEPLARRLVEHYLQVLLANPAHHDKVEFKIVLSCFTLDLEWRLLALKNQGFDAEERQTLRDSLCRLTNRIASGPAALFRQDLARVQALEQRQAGYGQGAWEEDPLGQIYWLLEDAKRYGTLPFAGIARAAFIARQMLDSLVASRLWSYADERAFLGSLDTVTARLTRDRANLPRDEFLTRYGHLRPGTYDLLSPRYDEAPERYFAWNREPAAPLPRSTPFEPTLRQARQLDLRLGRLGLQFDTGSLLTFMREALEGREQAKFVFTRNLSDLLRLLGTWGQTLGFTPEDLAHADITVLQRLYASSQDPRAALRASIDAGREAFRITRSLTLPPLLVEPSQVQAFSLPKSEPNFVTQGQAEGPPVSPETERLDLSGAIVMIPCADPGYDWIFSAGIVGFVTLYGGYNSHMAIRANELGTPAVIGAGPVLFEQWSTATWLRIDCLNHQVEVSP